MDGLKNSFQKETEKSQPLLSPSRNLQRLQQLRKMHNYPSEVCEAQPVDCQPRANIQDKAQCNPERNIQIQQDTIRPSRISSDPAEYSRTQQNIARHNRLYADTIGHSRIKQSILGKKEKEHLEEISISNENNRQLKKLEELEAKYLLCGPPISSKDSQVEYIIDGVDYFRRIHELIQLTRKGDTIFLSGLSLDPHFDLLNRPQGDPDHQELGDLLAEKAADGVNVRILLASGLATSSLPFPLPFSKQQWQLRRTLLPAIDLRTRIPKRRNVPDAPLAGRVALDWTGAHLGSNHQKFVIISRQGNLTALVTGLDFRQARYDQYPHNTLRLGKKRWGWHDASVLVTGPITESIWENFMLRWQEVSTLPKRPVRMKGLKFGPINTPLIEAIPDAPKQKEIHNPEVSMQTLRSFGKWKVDSLLPFCRKHWSDLPKQGITEIYGCLTKALGSARRYIYIEDQFLGERRGGKSAYEIYPSLVEAAKRNVKVILLGSGMYIKRSKVSRRVNRDIQKKVLDRLTPKEQRNIVVYQVEHLKIHSKVTLVDDEFASVGTANLFSRSMAGVDHELNVALVTTGTQVRDLRVKLWGEHLRSPMTDPDYVNALRDQETAFGIWRLEWLPETASNRTWRNPGFPKGFEPIEQVLKLVGPE
jgi:phosphatidylserine/phosphatidylglycerophosphate/cardiolipin synthase-like enzyme